jgi:hypothetical protein
MGVSLLLPFTTSPFLRFASSLILCLKKTAASLMLQKTMEQWDNVERSEIPIIIGGAMLNNVKSRLQSRKQ